MTTHGGSDATPCRSGFDQGAGRGHLWLVSIGWDGFGVAPANWAVLIIAVGALIGTAVVVRDRDVAYGLVLVWAYLGIVIKHTAATGFAGAYPVVIGVTAASMAVFVAAGVVAVRRRRTASVTV
jgi:hypothetical protein